MGSNTVRTFIAFNLEPKIQQAIGHIQAQLKKSDCNIKWVKPEEIKNFITTDLDPKVSKELGLR